MTRAFNWRRDIWDALGYYPSDAQWPMHNSLARVRLVTGGERSGKSFSTSMDVLRECCVPNTLGWIVGPTYELARPEWGYIASSLARAGVIVPGSLSWPRNGPCSLRTAWNLTIETHTADDPEKLAAKAPDWVLGCEAAQFPYEVFLRLRGRIAEKRGRLLLSGTLEGSLGWYAEMWQLWQSANLDGGQSFSLPTWSNLAVFPGGRDDPEILRLEATYPPERFQERFGGVPCPPSTLVFRDFSTVDHVRPCPIDPTLPVTVAIDPGYLPGYYAVLAVQFHGDEVAVCDEVYVQGMTHAQVINECIRRPWWPQVKGAVMDVAGRAHPANESAVEVWQRMTGLIVRSQPVGVQAGIDRHHTFLRHPLTQQPRLYHDPKCRGIIREYGLYKRPEDAEGRPIHTEPIDRDNHSLKALAYLLVDRFGFVDAAPRRQAAPRLAFQSR